VTVALDGGGTGGEVGEDMSDGPDWFTDAYTPSPGATGLITFHGPEHALGGIPGYEVAETTDENPERVAVLQRLSTDTR
jgi:hypothetical protein